MESSLSIIVSFVALFFTGLTYYSEYIYKKTCVKMTVCEYVIDKSVLSIELLFSNLGNQEVTITNAYLTFDIPSAMQSNNISSKKWITPFCLAKDQQKCIIIAYKTFPISDKYANVLVHVNSVTRDGNKHKDSFSFGQYYSDNCIFVTHTSMELLKSDIIVASA